MGSLGSVRIVQTHDAVGRPAPAEFLQPLPDAPSIELAVARLLAPFDPRPSDRPGVYFYRDPGRGSGWFEFVGLSPGGLVRAADALLIAGIERELGGGLAPFRNEDVHVPQGTSASRNPWFMIVFGVVGVGLGGWMVIVGVFATEVPLMITCLVMGALLAAAFTWLFVTGVRRVRWWHAARAAALRMGGRIPDRLQS